MLLEPVGSKEEALKDESDQKRSECEFSLLPIEKKVKQSLIGCLLRKYNPIVQSRANIVTRGTLIYWADLPGSKIKCFSVHYHNNLKCLAVMAIKSIKAACVVFSCKLNH